jgi:carbamoyl-phosphate synthase large subunit
VSKSIGWPLAKIAAKVMVGKSLKEMEYVNKPIINHFSVKQAVLPFSRFPEADTILGPEMKSTGEVMGIDKDFGMAFAKAQCGSGLKFPTSGNVFIGVKNSDKREIILIAKKFQDLGFGIYATKGTASVLNRNGVVAKEVLKVREGRPNIVDLIKNKEIALVINTPLGRGAWTDGYYIRTSSVAYGIPHITTLSAASVAVRAIESLIKGDMEVKSVQEFTNLEPVSSK